MWGKEGECEYGVMGMQWGGGIVHGATIRVGITGRCEILGMLKAHESTSLLPILKKGRMLPILIHNHQRPRRELRAMAKHILRVVLLLQILQAPHILAEDVVRRDVFAGVVAVLAHAPVLRSVRRRLGRLLQQRAREGAHLCVETGVEPAQKHTLLAKVTVASG